MTDLQKEPNSFQIYNSKVSINTLPSCSRAQLARFNGVDNPKIYVAIRGYIYDVTDNPDKYGVGKSYHKLVGKDVSRLLGLNVLALHPEQARDDPGLESTWDTSGLSEKQQETVDKWVLFFQARYKIVGVVIDHIQNR